MIKVPQPKSRPEGPVTASAFYAFPSVRGSGMDDAEFAERLLAEERVAVVPGRAFGIGGAGYVRCSYATAYEKIEQALDRIANFVRRHG